MKILVPIKRVMDPYVKIYVKNDHSGVETKQVKLATNPFDEIAVEEAIRLKEAGVATEIVVISIGEDNCQESLRSALAMGADCAIHIQAAMVVEPLMVAQCLKAIVIQQSPQLVIMGKQAIDDDCNQTGQMLAALLNWPQATFASKIKLIDAHRKVEVTREVDGGLETLILTLPAVITTDLRLNEPRYATLPNIMKAKQKQIKMLNIYDLGINLESHLEVLAVTPPEPRKAGKKVQDVSELIYYLRDVEKVI